MSDLGFLYQEYTIKTVYLNVYNVYSVAEGGVFYCRRDDVVVFCLEQIVLQLRNWRVDWLEMKKCLCFSKVLTDDSIDCGLGYNWIAQFYNVKKLHLFLEIYQQPKVKVWTAGMLVIQ